MATVGVRELKNRLSEYLRRVAEGEVVIVTDRGRVVAELRPPGLVPDPVPEGFEGMPLRFWQSVASGRIRLGQPGFEDDLGGQRIDRGGVLAPRHAVGTLAGEAAARFPRAVAFVDQVGRARMPLRDHLGKAARKRTHRLFAAI